ncbi:MAG: hypothetical protein C0501_28575 [Isosphaera sp.]|nr:hypothetical protein [Isosphaera sp.]
MKDESEPVTPDELVVRLVWAFHFKSGAREPVQREAFEPKGHETDGVSVFRAACLADPEQALGAVAAEKRDGYAVVLLPVADLAALGLTVQPAKIDTVPGHAVLPELNITDWKADKPRWRVVQKELARIASARVVRPPVGVG